MQKHDGNQPLSVTQAYLPYPQFGSINHMANTGHSSFHAGTIQYSKRYRRGLFLDSFYTYSKALDDCDSDGGTCTGVAPVSGRNLAKGRAGLRHAAPLRHPQLFGKITGETATANIQGEPLMNLMLRLSW